MDSGQSNLLTLIVLVIAVVIFVKLRSVLGRRTGDEPARFERFRAERAAAEAQARAQAEAKAATSPRRDQAAEANKAPESPPDRAHRMTQYAGGSAVLARGLVDIAAVDPRFEPADFLRGAKAAYEAIVMGFAEGNKNQLKDLLSPDVFQGFAAAIDERAARRETIEQSFVGIKAADIREAELHGATALVTVQFISELISVTRNAGLEIVAGDPKRVKDVNDVWTFARDVRSGEPAWHLVSTQAASV